jgi:hypothetical protein
LFDSKFNITLVDYAFDEFICSSFKTKSISTYQQALVQTGTKSIIIVTFQKPFVSEDGSFSSMLLSQAIKKGKRPKFPAYDEDSPLFCLATIIEGRWIDNPSERLLSIKSKRISNSL